MPAFRGDLLATIQSPDHRIPDATPGATYDDGGDVLYLHIGQCQPAADSEDTPEGHVLRFDDVGKIIGLTIINAKWLLARDGELTVTLPEQIHVTPAALEAALVAAQLRLGRVPAGDAGRVNLITCQRDPQRERRGLPRAI